MGSWIQYVPPIYGEIEEINADSYFDDPQMRPGYIFIGERAESSTTLFLTTWDYFYRWRPVIQEAQFNPQTDNHWNNVNVWTDGVPSSTSDARITKAGSLILPTINETAAVARTLTVFDADNTASSFELLNGVVSLTPASVFDTALKVGVANANGGERFTELRLVNSTLSSSGFAEIGKGQAGSGFLTANMIVDGSSRWLHPAGSIEIGGSGGRGFLKIKSNGLLAGSLLAGAATDPRVVVNPGGFFYAEPTSTVRLYEFLVNAGHWEPGYAPTSWGSGISGIFDTGLFHLGASTQGTAYTSENSNVKLGQIILERASWLELRGTAAADSIEVRDGVLQATSLTVGTAGGDINTGILTLGRDSGSSAILLVPATVSGESANMVTVHGAARLAQDGTANVLVSSGSALDIRGNLQLASTSATGISNLTITAATVSAQNVEVGTNGSDFDYGGSIYSPFQAGQATITLVGGTLNITGTSQVVLYPFEHTINNAGELTLGANDVIQGNGIIDFTNPMGGTLKASGLLSPGLASGDTSGELIIDGDLRLNNGGAPLSPAAATLQIDLGGTGAGEFDVLRVTGNANLTNATVIFSLVNGFAPQAGNTFYFLPVSGTLTGMFATLTDATGLGLTLADLSIAPDGGVMLTMPVSAIPEVGTILPALAAALVTGWRLRRQWFGRDRS